MGEGACNQSLRTNVSARTSCTSLSQISRFFKNTACRDLLHLAKATDSTGALAFNPLPLDIRLANEPLPRNVNRE